MKKFSLSSFAAGMVCTVAIFGLGTTAYAAYVNLNPSSTKLVVDGAAVNVTGYNVESRNYFQLRELAKTFDVSLEWEAATDTAYMDSTKPYAEETSAPVTTPPMSTAATLANGKAVTEEYILEILAEIEKEYPDGAPWGTEKNYFSPMLGDGNACAAFAFMASDRIWGEWAPSHQVQNANDIRAGDIFYNGTHYGVFCNINDKDSVYFFYASGNVSEAVSWGGYGLIESIDERIVAGTFVVYSRYPV